MIDVDDRYAAYQALPKRPPTETLAWNVYGKGIEAVGRDGLPEPVPVPPPAAEQLLVRVDAVGLCFSDVKLIRLGGEHPKLYGRDLASEPTRLGHETAVTVIEVGDALEGRYRPGQRLAIQPDIYVDGRSTAYGYTIPGGLIGYHVIGPEVLAADDGAYVVEVDDRLGYAETALTEPWACVEAAYTQRRRLVPATDGRAWVIGRPVDDRAYRPGEVLSGAREIVLSGLSDADVAKIRERAAPDTRVDVADERDVSGPFDDIILLGPRSAEVVSRAADALAYRGVLNLVADEPLDGPVELDIGRLHYHYTAFVGTTGLDVAASYGEKRNRAELLAGGTAVFIGAAGPMGQMHLERALRMPNGPARLVGVDLDADRMAAARVRLQPIAAANGRELVLRVPGEGETLASIVAAETGGRGADDVVVTAPSPAAVIDGATVMAPDGMLVLFAGLPVGTRASLDLSPVFLHGAQYTGTSGSRILDQERVVEKTLAGQLSPGRALAAVGGIDAARDGLQAMIDGRFPGKIVIFPQLSGLPLTSLDDLAAADPELAASLGEGGTWTREAEAILFARYWTPNAQP
ncbi:MAG TPA: alcohol dehydrogenase catalytic domain-containing protein [Candidatus Limnocylindria bacterium]|nr:alcohol dehydrogenase catalytic domain-containing protein [Candidatus Limnocylindria bacterium]